MITVKILISFLLLPFPWFLRRSLLCFLFGYSIHKSAKIGFSIVATDSLILSEGSLIGHFNMCKSLRLIELGPYSTISNFNWISGVSIREKRFFNHRENRDPSLVLGKHSAITNRHLIDCTDCFSIGDFSTVAGHRSQFLTHSMDLVELRQDCRSIKIGDYCFIGTGCVFLPGAEIGNKIVIGGLSLVNSCCQEEYSLYGGVPVKKIKEIDYESRYFSRDVGFVK